MVKLILRGLKYHSDSPAVVYFDQRLDAVKGSFWDFLGLIPGNLIFEE